MDERFTSPRATSSGWLHQAMRLGDARGKRCYQQDSPGFASGFLLKVFMVVFFGGVFLQFFFQGFGFAFLVIFGNFQPY